MGDNDLDCLIEGLYMREYDNSLREIVYLEHMGNGTLMEESIEGVRRQVHRDEYLKYTPLGEKIEWLKNKLDNLR